MRVVIMGCGRVGATVARQMAEAGHDVSVIDTQETAFDRLGVDFPGTLVAGSGVDQDVLERAGIATADCFLSVTNGDNRNLMAAQIAREVFHVPKVMTRVYDPSRQRIYRALGLHTYCPTLLGAGIAAAFFGEGAEAADRAMREASGLAALAAPSSPPESAEVSRG